MNVSSSSYYSSYNDYSLMGSGGHALNTQDANTQQSRENANNGHSMDAQNAQNGVGNNPQDTQGQNSFNIMA